MEQKQGSKEIRDEPEYPADKAARFRNRALKEHTEWLINKIMQGRVAQARLRDPIKRK